MKKLVPMVIMLVLVTCSVVFAEPSFDQIQTLIKEQNYTSAVKGLEIIISNHPRSSKAYYSMAQAQAGLGNQTKAKEALDIATGIDPTLKFAGSSNVKDLKEAIQPQTNKINAIESHTGRNILIALFLIGAGIGAFFYFRKKKSDEESYKTPTPKPVTPLDGGSSIKYPSETIIKFEAKKVEEPVRTVETVNRPYVPRTQTSEPVRVARTNSEMPIQRTTAHHVQSTPTPAPTTVINNSGGSDMLTGVLIGNMLSNNHHNTHTERIVEREVVREEPSYHSSSRYDEPETKSSSWDDDRSSSSSSWDSGSSSSTSSSWDSGSSSSSSSWSSSDSGSSWSSSDSGSSSSSWD